MSERFELPTELNIYCAMETRDALLAWVTENADQGADILEVSAREVAEVDGSGLQLLASFSQMGHAWRLVEPSEAFSDACRTLGFTDWLDRRRTLTKSAGASK